MKFAALYALIGTVWTWLDMSPTYRRRSYALLRDQGLPWLWFVTFAVTIIAWPITMPLSIALKTKRRLRKPPA